MGNADNDGRREDSRDGVLRSGDRDRVGVRVGNGRAEN